jgi:sugar phosphate isomerase/epimerase
MSPLAVQLYSVRKELAADLGGTLGRLAQIGYREVEPYDPVSDPVGFRAALDAAGLKPCSTHYRVVDTDRETLRAAMQTIGTDTVIQPYLPPEGFTDAAGIAENARLLNEAAQWYGEHGMRVGYHNHHFELAQQVDGVPALEALAAALDPAVFLEVDVYWAATGGADVPALLGRLGDRVKYLHVKDGPAVLGEPMTAVGAGTVPIPAILDAAPDARRVVELDECATDMVEALAESYRYLDTLAKS